MSGEEPSPDGDVYLCLLKVYLDQAGDAKSNDNKDACRTQNAPAAEVAEVAPVSAKAASLDDAVSLLERRFDRVDPVKVSVQHMSIIKLPVGFPTPARRCG